MNNLSKIFNIYRSKLALALFLLLVVLFVPKSAFASSLYLSPASGSIGLGSTLSVQVRLSAGGDTVNGVSAFLSYPADKLDVAFINYGGSFSIAAEGSSGGGSIRISRGNISGVSGDVNVATIGFRGKSLGDAKVGFVGGSAAPRASDSSDSLNLGASKGGSFTITNATPKPATSTTGPKITDISTQNIATNSATIVWKTDKKATTTVEYGLEKDSYILQVTKNESVTDHTITLQNNSLLPGAKIHFHIRSKDVDGNESVSPDATVQLKGYQVKLKLFSGNAALPNVTVFLYSDPSQGTTNSSGEVMFPDVTAGKHLVLIKADKTESSTEITVADNHNFQTPQEFTIKADALKQSASAQKSYTLLGIDVVYLIIAGLIVLVIIVVVVYLIRKKKDEDQSSGSIMSPPFPNNN